MVGANLEWPVRKEPYRGLKRDGRKAGSGEWGIGGKDRGAGALYFSSHSASNSICASLRF